jgi:hypothetical protein
MRLAALVLVSVLGFARFSAGQAVVPVANAGPDVTVPCAGPDGTPVALDGMGSSIGPTSATCGPLPEWSSRTRRF